jgi:hypothetical protein
VTLSFGSSPWLLFLAAILAAGFSFWAYRQTIPDLSAARKQGLGVLRFLTLFLVLLLLFEPVLQRSRQATVEPVIGVLVDQSESMVLADSLPNDKGIGTSDLVATLKRATAGMQTSISGFGARTEVISDLDSIAFTLDRTDLATALTETAASLSDRPLAGLILATDGLYNAGANPLYAAERFPVPIHTVALGDPSEQKDVRIEDVLTNELTYADMEVPVLVRIRNDGMDTEPVVVTLFSGETQLAQADGVLPPSGNEVSLELRYPAGEPGRKELRVVMSRYPDEVTYRNNEARVDVRVLEQKKSILLLAASPSPDVSAMVRLLSTDETVSLTVRTQQRDGTWYEGALEPLSEGTDLIMAMGFPGPTSTPEDVRFVADAIQTGTPFMYVDQLSSSRDRLGEQFGSLLPLIPPSSGPTYVPGTLQPSPAAAAHAIFDIDGRTDVGRWRRLPPLALSERAWSAAPGAVILATSEIRDIALPDPVFAVLRRGQIKTAVLATPGLWRWMLVPEDLEQDARAVEQLFRNMVQWLFAADDDRLVRVEPAEQSFAEGDAVVLRGQVYDEALRPISDASMSVQLTSPQGQVFPYEMQPRGNGRYVLDTGTLPAGMYQYEAVALRDGQALGTDSGSFSIGQRTREFRRTRADFDLLRQIAARSGGTMVMANDPEGLEQAIRNSPAFTPRTESSTESLRLWQWYPLLLLLLTLLSTEWFLRKRWGLV